MTLDFIKIVSEHIDRENSSAVVIYHCDWDERLDQAQDLAGGLTFDDSGTGSYQQPQQYQYGLDIYVAGVDITALGDYGSDPDDYGNFPVTAELSVTYGPLKLLNPDGTDGIDICQVTTTVSAEMLPLPTGQYAWPDGSVLNPDTDVKPSMVDPYIEMTVKVVFAAAPMLDDLNDLVGMVNANPITIADASFDANTVLLLGGDLEEVVNSQGQPAWQRNLKFGVRDNDGLGWNAFYNVNDQEYQVITDVDSGDPPYDSGALENLFNIQ